MVPSKAPSRQNQQRVARYMIVMAMRKEQWVMVAGSICNRAICCMQARPQSSKIRADPTSTRIAELPRSGSGHGVLVPRKQISIVRAPFENHHAKAMAL
jgi:hypothetical protein